MTDSESYTTLPFDSYEITYFTKEYPFMATLYLYQAGKWVGGIFFVPDGAPIPHGADNQPILYYPLSRFNDVITILREEKPLYIIVYATGGGYLATTKEPVGEQEAFKVFPQKRV